jgi:N-acyl-D-amino-acid deacylase
MLDFVFKNCKVIDGSGNLEYKADVAVLGDQIAKIALSIDQEARRTVDVAGKILCPGFIDMHTHSDLRVLAHPEEDMKLMQGITTALLGQDGLSVAPIDEANKELMKLRLSGLNGSYVEHWNWNRLGEYLDAVDGAAPAANSLMLAPHGTIRATAVGWENRKAAPAELDRMKVLLNEAFDDGAAGFSTGLIYPPGMYADREEMLALLSLTGQRGGFFVVHMRNESDFVLQSVDEVVGLCLSAECPLHISHLKVAGKKNWGLADKLLEKLEKARADGLDLTFDQYPYTAGSTMLDAVIPPSQHSGGVSVLLEKLKDASYRKSVLDIIEGRTPEVWENWASSCGWETIFINSVATERNRDAEGRSLAELAELKKRHPFDIAADLLVEENDAVTMTHFYGSEEDVKTILKHPYGTFCTDGIVGGKPHPRVYGASARILQKYVREEKVLSLPAAIRRMTSFPAERLKLRDRGLIQEGMKADIVIFDPDTVQELGTYKEPNRYPIGFEFVMVAGQPAMEGGKLTGLRMGRTLRRKI